MQFPILEPCIFFQLFVYLKTVIIFTLGPCNLSKQVDDYADLEGLFFLNVVWRTKGKEGIAAWIILRCSYHIGYIVTANDCYI